MLKRGLLILVLFFLLPELYAQQEDSSRLVMGIIEGNDTIIQVLVKDIWVFPDRKFTSKRQQQRYSKYVEKVKKVYPLAVEARILLQKYEPVYYSLDNQRDRRKLMKNLEKELLDKHKEELKKWSISDGKILLKLINRETDRTAYSIIKDFRGEFSAVFWQGIARLFKNNLKDGYDPEEEDKILEEVVRKIEMGYY
ncbi:MAG: DUF4294 domain-containing protein [Bacteroidetes bacterium]|nr:MAG: DUF4294 domain-containing protein [Bacteroidota bacterium]